MTSGQTLGGILGAVFVIWAFVTYSSPKDDYTNHSPITAQSASTSKVRASLTGLMTQAEAFERGISAMPSTAHADLPTLQHTLQTALNVVQNSEVPPCLSAVKSKVLVSMTYGVGAVQTNHAGGIGMKNPDVIIMVSKSGNAIAEAAAEVKKLNC